MLSSSLAPVRPDARFDTIRVETVADYIIRIIDDPASRGTFHISSGPDLSLTWKEILTLASSSLDLTRLPEFTFEEDYGRSSRSLPQEERLKIGRLGLYIPFMNQNIVFSNERLISQYGRIETMTDFLKDYLAAAMPRVQPRYGH